MHILSIFGTRPEAVKMAPVVRELAKTSGILSRVCVTAQHRQMLDQVLELFEIKPDIDLNLMQPDQSLSDLTSMLFDSLDMVIRDENPDWVLAQGDTTTVMVASLVSYYHRVRFGHVEAGLRTFNKWQPFPEEINRKVAGIVADLHFAPTSWAKNNLLGEGISNEKIIVSGNPVIDALHTVAGMPDCPETIEILEDLGLATGNPLTTSRLLLVTAHRRENFGKPLENICAALVQLAQKYGDTLKIIYPVHLNPNVHQTVHRILDGISNIYLYPPLNYLPLVQLLKRATLVLTDSGGLQEEAPGFGVPVLVMREVTERPEGVEAGTVKLVGTETNRIVEQARRLLDNAEEYQQMAKAVNPYGDGHAAERIVKALLKNNAANN
jgi:UDP-N-acetylglucosamine 2-epimerase (non-hydrolysing)